MGLLSAALLLAGMGVANAAVIFTDRTAFEASISIVYNEDFQTLGPGTQLIGTPLLMPTGLTVSAPNNDVYTAGPGQSTNPTQAIGSNNPRSDSLDFDLGGDFLAVGADLFQNNGGGSQFAVDITYQLSFYDDGGLVDTILATVVPNGGSFIGFIADAVFDRVEIMSLYPGGSYEVADNITVGNAVRVPEPATLSMLGIGLIGLGLVRRRRTA